MRMTVFRSLMLQIVTLAMVGTAIGVLQARAQDPAAPPPPGQDAPRNGGGPGGGRGNQVESLTKKLNLTPDHVTQVTAIEADAATQRKPLNDEPSVAGTDKRAKRMDIH